MDHCKPEHYDKRLYNVKDYEEVAGKKFYRFAYDYFNSGANDMISLNEQYEVFKNMKLK